MQTSDWAKKFGLRTGKFGLAIEKFGLRTGKVRTADSVRTFADWESSDWESSDWESSDFGLSPNFRTAQKKTSDRTGLAEANFGLQSGVRTSSPPPCRFVNSSHSGHKTG